MKNPPAFPVHFESAIAAQQTNSTGLHGMTLRDYFAAKAMQGLLTRLKGTDGVADMAYRYADAMLKAREPA
ncbi:MAG: hypothetical protein FGM36_16060 [Burkholderiaceae bacterium]|nr:hypothetical protein [Burkholderiaceae bacterium]